MGCDCMKTAGAWDKLPKGWTQESLKKFWETMTGDVKHKVKKCMKEMEGKVGDTGAFCASLADKVDKGWRSRKSFVMQDVSKELLKIAQELVTPVDVNNNRFSHIIEKITIDSISQKME